MKIDRRFRDDDGESRGRKGRDRNAGDKVFGSGFGDNMPGYVGDKFTSVLPVSSGAPAQARPASARPASAGGPKEKATVKNYNAERGFGFVRTDSGDLFFHINSLKPSGFVGDPKPGDVLLISRGPGKDGREAVASAAMATT